MPFIKERKPFRVGDSIAITLPKDWTELLSGKKLKLIADKVAIIIPPGLTSDQAKEHLKELIDGCV